MSFDVVFFYFSMVLNVIKKISCYCFEVNTARLQFCLVLKRLFKSNVKNGLTQTHIINRKVSVKHFTLVRVVMELKYRLSF